MAETNNNPTIPRAPIVTVMGHIDHGKSTLIDFIRHTNLTEKEAGGITQHVSAYEIKPSKDDKKSRPITFLDTPGHEAFGGIRKRGANTADIAILVVSAEDGVKPQTLEARDRILESKAPFIVAINKIDKPSADIERAKQSLAENNIYVEGYGGDVPFVPVSAKTGEGVGDLLEMIGLVADLAELKYDPKAFGSGVIIESKLDPKRGVTSVAVIKNGVVRKGMIAATAGATAPLRLILDAASNQVEEIEAGRPIQIIGWSSAPQAGMEFKTFSNKNEAEEFANTNIQSTINNKQITREEGVESLPLIVKADTAGSLEAVTEEINKLSRERIIPQVINSSIGTVNENDVKAAIAASGATILGFNVKTDARANALAERSEITIANFNIIYELIDRVKEVLEAREPRIEVEETFGRAKVLKIFSTLKGKQVLGGRVNEGEVRKGGNFKILRRESEIGKGKIKELQQSKLDIDSVQEGNEFGSLIESKIEAAPGDILEFYTTVTK